LVNMPSSLTVTGTTLNFDQTENPTGSPVDLSTYNGAFSSSATIVIRKMILATGETYNEAKNTTAIAYQAQIGRYQHTGTLTTSGDVYYVGGADTIGATPVGDGESPGGSGLRGDDALVEHDGDFTSASGTMPTSRAYHTATLLPDGTILVAGGESAPGMPLASADIYSPTAGTFTQTTSPMSVSRSNHTATLLTNGRVLITGGFQNQSSTDPTNGAEIYYPNTHVFEPTSSMVSPRANHTAILLPDGSVIVMGGNTTAGNYLNTVEQYLPLTATWTTLAAMPNALADHTATLLQDGRILVIGGQTSSGASSAVYAYTPGTNSWATLASMPIALYGHTATLMFDGRVLVAGGDTGGAFSKNSYIYDPGSNTWTASGALTQAREQHTATLLPNGTVMISGGLGTPAPTWVEVYHVDGSTWAPIGVFPAARTAHTMTLALDGKVYAIGGFAGVTFYNSVLSRDFSGSPDAATTGAPPSLRQSTIMAITAYPFEPTATSNFNVTGIGFEGGTEASGG
ncbi:MAG: Kelch repeat-containing protein, partial [Trebonia sp.]